MAQTDAMYALPSVQAVGGGGGSFSIPSDVNFENMVVPVETGYNPLKKDYNAPDFFDSNILERRPIAIGYTGTAVIDLNKAVTTNDVFPAEADTCAGTTDDLYNYIYGAYIETAGDIDWYKGYKAGTNTLRFILVPPYNRDYDIEIYDDCSTSKAQCLNGTGVTENCTATVTNDFYVKVHGFNNAYNNTARYHITAKGSGACNGSLNAGVLSKSSYACNDTIRIDDTRLYNNDSTTMYHSFYQDLYTPSNNYLTEFTDNKSYSILPGQGNYYYWWTEFYPPGSGWAESGTYTARAYTIYWCGENIQTARTLTYPYVSCAPSCTNECSSGQQRCNSSYSQTCGNYDSDSCYEWPSSTTGSGNIYCSYDCDSLTGNCKNDPCSGITCGNYCSGETRYYSGFCTSGSCGNYLTENCNSYDGYACNASTKEYRDYYCSPNSCSYTVTTSTNCNTLDAYGSWEYYCSGNDRRQHRKFYDYGCSGKDCSVTSSNYVDDSLVEACRYSCTGSAPSAYCNNGCSGQLTVKVETIQETALQNASVYVNGTLKGTTDVQGKSTIPTLSSSCGETFSIRVVSAKGTDCGTKTTIIDSESDNDTIMFVCKDPMPKLKLGAVPGTYTYVIGEIINFSVQVFNELSQMLTNVDIGVNDPLKNQSSFRTVPSFPWNYSTSASKTGTSEFQFTASKTGYEKDVKKVAVSVESLPSIKVMVNDLQGNAVGNALIYLDGSYLGEPDSLGVKYVQATKGTHEIRVNTPTREFCNSRNVTFGGQTEALFNCCNIGYECKDANTIAYRNSNCSLTQETTCIYGCDSSKKECLEKFEPERGTCDCSLSSSSDYQAQIFPAIGVCQVTICPAIETWAITTGAAILTTLGIYMVTQLNQSSYSYYGIPKYDWGKENLAKHYNDHALEFTDLFGYYPSKNEYADKCRDLLNSTDRSIPEYRQPANPSKGDPEGFARYDYFNNIYVVGDTLGRIVTCYRPKHPKIDAGRRYIENKEMSGELLQLFHVPFIGIWEA